MTDYEAKFYDQGITINRCVAVKTEDTKCDLYPGTSTGCALCDQGLCGHVPHAGRGHFCLQETKLQPGQIALDLPGYHQYWCSAEKKGYSGTAVFTKAEPLDVQYNLGLPQHDLEGRVITAEYPEFYLVCVYTPNAQDGLRRLEYRMSWMMRSASSSARSTGTSRSSSAGT